MKACEPFPDVEDDKRGPQLLLEIWTKPAATLGFILAKCPDKYVTALLALGGTARAVDRVARQHDGDYLALTQVSSIALLLGAVSGWLTYYVYGWALSATGRWLGGTAQPEKARVVLAWALVPVVAGLGLVTLYVALFNNELFILNPATASYLHHYLGIGLLTLQGVVAAWALVILTKGLQMIQGFSLGRTLANVLLPGAVLISLIVFLSAFYDLL